MNATRLISTLAAVVAALVAASPAAAEAPPSPVGTARTVAPPTMLAPEGPGGGVCWAKELLRSKGTWPYVRRLYLYTIWCGSGGLITYRSSSVRTDHDTLCWTEAGPYLSKTAGGAGYTFVEVQASAGTACHSALYFISYHDTMMLRVRYYPNGAYATVAYS